MATYVCKNQGYAKAAGVEKENGLCSSGHDSGSDTEKNTKSNKVGAISRLIVLRTIKYVGQ